MKRIYFSAAFLAVTLIGAFFQLWYVGSKADKFSEQMDVIDEYMLKDDFENAVELSRKIEEEWDETASNIDIFLIHDYVDSISVDMSHMRASIENGDPQMYFYESAGIKKGLTSLKESEYPYFENLI